MALGPTTFIDPRSGIADVLGNHGSMPRLPEGFAYGFIDNRKQLGGLLVSLHPQRRSVAPADVAFRRLLAKGQKIRYHNLRSRQYLMRKRMVRQHRLPEPQKLRAFCVCKFDDGPPPKLRQPPLLFSPLQLRANDFFQHSFQGFPPPFLFWALSQAPPATQKKRRTLGVRRILSKWLCV